MMLVLLASMTYMEFDEGAVHLLDNAKSNENEEGDKTSEEETKCFESNDSTSLKSSGEETTW
eukprot:11965372-Ditylum_brightwellii.AAC.1